MSETPQENGEELGSTGAGSNEPTESTPAAAETPSPAPEEAPAPQTSTPTEETPGDNADQ